MKLITLLIDAIIMRIFIILFLMIITKFYIATNIKSSLLLLTLKLAIINLQIVFSGDEVSIFSIDLRIVFSMVTKYLYILIYLFIL